MEDSRFESQQWQEICLKNIKSGSGAHPASYAVFAETSFLGGTAGGAWCWPYTSIYINVNNEWNRIFTLSIESKDNFNLYPSAEVSIVTV